MRKYDEERFYRDAAFRTERTVARIDDGTQIQDEYIQKIGRTRLSDEVSEDDFGSDCGSGIDMWKL